ncbi:AraC family transcriptional regulator [Comamonas composti]|uniref:AraC family transcriptional regulator n=1 Tax=Comamonas composti TaxID=408558 RepID=UPI000402E294|nr:AraC family transcriptional regulator [Comamonas composti]
MDAIRNVLITDAQGAASLRHRLVASSDWDEVQHWCRQVYMPYEASPQGPARRPDSVLDAVRIGHFTLSRFSYGIPVHLREFSAEAGLGMVLTTLRGAIRHWSCGKSYSDTGIGEAFLVDNSRTHYRLDADAEHLQVNLTFAHEAMAGLYERWFGRPADERMWSCKFRFGGAQSSWIALLSYACRCITQMPEAVEQGPLGRHLEETLGMHLLTLWRQQLDQPEAATVHRLAPRHVLAAEQYMREHARQAPTLSELAAVAGVSVRTLSAAFREFRGCTPMQALRELRLSGVRAELLLAPQGATVRDLAAQWGYASFGLFAAAYRKRFDESPSATLYRR